MKIPIHKSNTQFLSIAMENMRLPYTQVIFKDTCTAMSVQTCLKDCTNLHYLSQYTYMKNGELYGQFLKVLPPNIASGILRSSVAKAMLITLLSQRNKEYRRQKLPIFVWCNFPIFARLLYILTACLVLLSNINRWLFKMYLFVPFASPLQPSAAVI